MKTHPHSSRVLLAAVAIIVVFLSPRLWSASNDATDFPYAIAVDLGSVDFALGDSVVITSLRGNRPHLETGGRYLLEGTYTLVSVENAKLGWSITTRGPSGPTPIAQGENMMVSKGVGEFRLIKTFLSDGWPHVSFYANGRSHGGVYFGEAGVENTVLRNKSWSDFSERPSGAERPGGIFTMTVGRGMDPSSPANPSPSTAVNADPSSSGNAAIMAYLGNPVPPPANLHARYSPEGLAAAFAQLSKNAGWEVLKLSVDDSEFPYLVYGVIANRRDLAEMKSGLGAMAGYVYGGSVTGSASQGFSFFALNMTPSDQYPRGQAEAVHRRLMIRLQMLAKKVQK